MSDIIMYNPNDEEYIKQTLLQLSEFRKNSNNITKGMCRIILDGKIQENLIPNIVTGTGRIYSSQKLFNQKFNTDNDYRDWSISHFGFGQGGAVIIEGGGANIISPDGCDQDLNDPIPLCDVNSNISLNFLTSPGDEFKSVLPTPYVVKPIGSNITLLQSEDLTCQYGEIHTYIQCNCINAIGEPNYLLNDTDYIIINEAALYYTKSIETRLFAHICFPPQYIQKKSEFVIEWYILC